MDRLRRLDALFAERVLGISPPHRYINEPLTVDEQYDLAGRTMNDPPLHIGWMRAYTRSLDAAWAGVVALNANVTIERYPYPHGISMCVDAFLETEGSSGEACENHPAEALVLACLRAVGCREDELK